MKIKLDKSKFDFSDITVLEYLEFFGYKNPRRISETIYEVDTIGVKLPTVKVLF